MVAWYKCPDDGEVCREAIHIVTDDKIHDHHGVACYTDLAIDHLKNTRKVDFTQVIEWTDGVASQFKSKIPLTDILYGLTGGKIWLERNYFGSCHGKGASDGEGSVVKSFATRAIKAQPNVCIKGAEDFFNVVSPQKTVGTKKEDGSCCHSRRKFFLVSEDSVNRDWPERVAKTVPGTRKMHSVVGVHPGLVYTHRFTCTCAQCRDGHHLQCTERQVAMSPVLLRREDGLPWPVPVTSHGKY